MRAKRELETGIFSQFRCLDLIAYLEEVLLITACSLEMKKLNRELRNGERIYNTVRPHQALGYLTPQRSELISTKGMKSVTHLLDEYKGLTSTPGRNYRYRDRLVVPTDSLHVSNALDSVWINISRTNLDSENCLDRNLKIWWTAPERCRYPFGGACPWVKFGESFCRREPVQRSRQRKHPHRKGSARHRSV